VEIASSQDDIIPLPTSISTSTSSSGSPISLPINSSLIPSVNANSTSTPIPLRKVKGLGEIDEKTFNQEYYVESICYLKQERKVKITHVLRVVIDFKSLPMN
jgi:hypothetical protein